MILLFITWFYLFDSPKPQRIDNKKRGLFTFLYCLLWYRQTPIYQIQRVKAHAMSAGITLSFLDRILLNLAIFRRQECTS